MNENRESENPEIKLGEGWDEAEQVAKERSGAFIKLDDGKSTFVSVVSKPIVYEKAFNPGDEPATRFKVKVLSIPDCTLKTWDMSKTTFEILKRQRARRENDFDNAVFELGRTGTDKQTKYWLEYVRQINEEESAKRQALTGIPF